jgi:hypothetical protein
MLYQLSYASMAQTYRGYQIRKSNCKRNLIAAKQVMCHADGQQRIRCRSRLFRCIMPIRRAGRDSRFEYVA